MAKPATVLFVAWAPFLSGAERALARLILNLDPSRYRPVVALGTPGQLATELTNQGIPVVQIPITYASARAFPTWATTVGRLARLAQRERAVIVHSNDVPSFQPAGYAARVLGLPAVTHVRFPDTNAGFRWFLKPGFERALFVSEALRAAALVEAEEVFRDRSEVVYDGVPVLPACGDEERLRLRRELGLPVDQPVVVLAGQVSEVKGVWEFVAAARILADRRRSVCFAVLGDDMKNNGALRLEAEREVQRGGIADRVRFLGFRPDAARLIPAFDIVAVPSHVEPLGNSTLEAMAAARPVVGSRVGGIPEMVVDGLTGLLVEPKDAASLAEAIDTLVLNPARAQALGEAGRVRAAQIFDLTSHAAHVQGIYDSVIEARGRKRRQKAS